MNYLVCTGVNTSYFGRHFGWPGKKLAILLCEINANPVSESRLTEMVEAIKMTGLTPVFVGPDFEVRIGDRFVFSFKSVAT